MIKKLGIVIFILFGVALLIYLAWPGPTFPNALSDFHISSEPADKETPFRRGYYTNLKRADVMTHYAQEFIWGLRLNYPPEEAQTIIRDQTRATFLEEIVHPMRESLFVAGDEVKPGKSLFEKEGGEFGLKVFVKYIDSNVIIRLLIGVLSLSLIWILGDETIKTAKEYTKWISR